MTFSPINFAPSHLLTPAQARDVDSSYDKNRATQIGFYTETPEATFEGVKEGHDMASTLASVIDAAGLEGRVITRPDHASIRITSPRVTIQGMQGPVCCTGPVYGVSPRIRVVYGARAFLV